MNSVWFRTSPWPLKSIREVCLPKETTNPQKKPKEEFDYIDISSVDSATRSITTPKRLIGENAPSRARKRIRSGDVILATTRPYLKSIAMVGERFDGQICSTGFAVLRARDSIVPEWLFHTVTSDEFIFQLTAVMRGANYPAVRDSDVSEAKIPVPPVNEQHRIVARIQECFNRVEEMEQLVEHQEDSFVNLKRALVFGEPGESSRREVVKHSTEWIQGTEKVRKGERYQFAGVKSFGRGVFFSAEKTSDDFEYGQLRRLKTNDFIYPKLMAWEGAFGMVPEALSGMVVSPEFVVFRTDESRLLPEVLDTYFRSPACLPEVNAASTGSNRRRRRLNPKAFLELRVPVPPMARQKKLREVYRLESEMLGDVESTKSELRSLRNAILRQAFAGEL